MSSQRALLLLTAALLLCPLPGRAQEGKAEDADLAFWSNSQRQQAAAAAEIVAIQDPLAMLAMTFEGKRLSVWSEPEFIGVDAPPLNPDWLPLLKDDTPPPDFRKVDLITEVKKHEWAYRTIYRDALLKAFETPLDILRRSGEKTGTVSVDNLMTHPNFYRGKVVTLHGKLRKLVVMDPPPDLRPPLENLYEAWIVTADDERPAVCVVSLLPKEFHAHKNTVLKKPMPVTFHGYFLLRYQYPIADKESVLRPLLIGQTLEVGAPEPKQAATATIPIQVFIALGVVFVVVIVLMLALQRWYRISDRKIMERVNRARAAHVAERDEGLFQDAPAAAPIERNGDNAKT